MAVLVHILKRIESRDSNRNLNTHGHSTIIHNSQNVETTQVPINRGWINKMWSILAVEYYSGLRRNKILIHAMIRMNSENVLNEISQTQKDKYHTIPLR